MSEFRFTLTIEGPDVLTDAAQEGLFDARCSDATFGLSDGIFYGLKALLSSGNAESGLGDLR